MSDNTPKKFVNLHGHSDLGSIGDAIGAPQDHIDFAVSNGSDALALTDHGNLQGFSSQFLHAKKLKDKGVNFKAISGVEAYYIPSLKDWRVAKNEASLEKDNAKEAKRVSKLSAKDIGDELASTKAELTELAGEVVKADEDEMGGTVIENDEETRSNKWRNPVNRRNHLVLLAKNSEGLKAIFRLVSASYIDGFYRYPRIDLEMLKREAKGNIVASSACVSGNPMFIIAGHQTEQDFNLWFPNDNNFELIQAELKTMIEEFKDALGEENYNLELQFHNLPAQHLLNYHLIEASKRTNTPLIVTCDSHYSRPEHWKARELYKAMAWASKTKGSIDATKLPERIEDLKCELYPKNTEQLWASYKQYTEPYDFYDDSIVKDAIERTWDIAHNQIGEVSFNRSVKLPVIEQLVSKVDLDRAIEKLGSSEDEDAIAFEELKRIAKNGLITRGKEEEEEYIARLVYELGVIKELKFSKYFLTFSRIMSIVSKEMLIGYGRGSAGGSLLSYCLGITQVDPIKYGLLFERFLTRLKKNSFPDIDVDFADREKAVKLISTFFGEENVVSVSNFNKLQLRSLLKDVSRFANIPFDEINKYTGKIEAEALAEAKKTPGFDRAMWVLTYEEAETNSASFRELMTKYPDLEANVKVLFKQMRNLSRHASGVIITSNARENMPIIKSGDVLQTPWPEGLNARHLEDFGLLKFDILGLGTLRIVENTIRKIIRKTTGEKYITFDMIKQWYEDNLHPDKLDLTDRHVYENVWRDGKYAGVFQFISANVQKFMTNMKPMSINDLAIGTSIFRPGPLCLSGDTEVIVDRHVWAGKKSHTYKTIEQLYNEKTNPVAHGRYKTTILSYDESTKSIVPNEMLNVVKSGKKEVYSLSVQLRTEGVGKEVVSFPASRKNTIKCVKSTLDHRFLTTTGWKRLEDIKVGENLLFLNHQFPQETREKTRTKGHSNFRNIAFANYDYKCALCDWSAGSLDVNHLNENRTKNNEVENLGFLCPNHHREFSEGNVDKDKLFELNQRQRLLVNEDIRCVRYLGKTLVGIEETYDICMTTPHNNFLAGGFVVHNSAGVDKLYLNNRSNLGKIEYKHPLQQEVLGETAGVMVFQEQLQMMYHKLAGVPLEETDSIRKAFTKKDLSNKEKAAKDRAALREGFADKCLAVNDIPKKISYEIFDDMEKMVAYSFNKSHAVAYSIISYTCAWLLTYHSAEWITSYIDYCATEKGKQAGKEDPKAIAISEAKGLGFSIGKPDINHSERDYVIIDDQLIPSFSSLKHVGTTVLNEINEFRPYKSIEDLLFNADDTWRHSKFNKRALSTLVKLEGFASMGLVGDDCMFENYRQLHYVLIEKGDDLKKAATKKKKTHRADLATYIEEAQELDDWSLGEKVEFSKSLSGMVDIDMIVTPDIADYFRKQGIASIDNREDDDQWVWCIVKSSKEAKTKAGKPYMRMKVYGASCTDMEIFVWNFKPPQDRLIPDNSLIIGRFKKTDFGMSSFFGGLEIIGQ